MGVDVHGDMETYELELGACMARVPVRTSAHLDEGLVQLTLAKRAGWGLGRLGRLLETRDR